MRAARRFHNTLTLNTFVLSTVRRYPFFGQEAQCEKHIPDIIDRARRCHFKSIAKCTLNRITMLILQYTQILLLHDALAHFSSRTMSDSGPDLTGHRRVPRGSHRVADKHACHRRPFCNPVICRQRRRNPKYTYSTSRKQTNNVTSISASPACCLFRTTVT